MRKERNYGPWRAEFRELGMNSHWVVVRDAYHVYPRRNLIGDYGMNEELAKRVAAEANAGTPGEDWGKRERTNYADAIAGKQDKPGYFGKLIK